MVRCAGSYMLQIITTQPLTAEGGAPTDTTVLLFNLPTRKLSSVSESTPVLLPTMRTCPKFTDKVPDDIILAVKHSRAHFQKNLLREQDDCMRNKHFRTTTFSYKDNTGYFSKSPIWNIWQRIQERDFQECCLKVVLENCLDWCLRISEQVVTVPPDQLELGSTEAPLHPCHAGNPCTKRDQYQGKNTHQETKMQHCRTRLVIFATHWGCLGWQNQKSLTALTKSFYCSILPLSNSYMEEPSNKHSTKNARAVCNSFLTFAVLRWIASDSYKNNKAIFG